MKIKQKIIRAIAVSILMFAILHFTILLFYAFSTGDFFVLNILNIMQLDLLLPIDTTNDSVSFVIIVGVFLGAYFLVSLQDKKNINR